MPRNNHFVIMVQVEELARLIDYCAANGACDYDVACIVAANDNLKALHRYNDNGWEFFDVEKKEWTADPKGAHMSHSVMCTVSSACNARALYWQNKVMKNESTDPYFDDLRVMSLIELALKFRDKKAFTSAVVNECKAFFE
jgi:hypothetical protein